MGVMRTFQVLGRIFRKRKLRRRGLSTGAKRRTGEIRGFANTFESSSFFRAATGIAFLLLAVVVIWMGGYYYWPKLTVGQEAMEDIHASIGFTFRDDEATEQLRREAAQNVPPLYKLDERRIAADLDGLIDLLKKVGRGDEDSSSGADLFEKVSKLLDSRSSEEVKELLGTQDAAALLAKLKLTIVKASQYRISPTPVSFPSDQIGVETRAVNEVQLELRERIRKDFPPPINESSLRLMEAIASDLTSIFTAKYRREDLEAVRKLRTFASKSVSVQFTTVEEGTKVIERGEEITPRHVAQIEEMRRILSLKRSPTARLANLVGAALAVCALTVGTAIFLARFHSVVFKSNSRLMLIALVTLMSMAASKALLYLWPASAFFSYPVAAPFGAFVLSMMLGLRLAGFMAIPMAVLLGMSFGSSLSPVLVGILGGWAAAFFAGSVRHRKDLLKTGFVVGLVNGCAIAAVGALEGAKVGTLAVQAAGGISVALGAILVAAVFLPVLEWVFKTPTNISLVELMDSNHPLLKRMIMEAPGTYYHSLMVGNLAESAAETVGANPLLARVGSYFHDIGKLKKPLYFSENEAFGRSKHDTLSPRMSNLIILSHVKDGVDVACKYKLNRALLDVIKQHHGTSLNYYFYKRAEELNEEGASIAESEFRYPGPRPQTQEAAIIMLADSVEAASRSLERPTAAKIRAVVKSIIRARLEDGQLDGCDVTLKDLHGIEETFNRILMNTLHPRVKYPEEEKTNKGETSERPIQELAEGSERHSR